MAKADDQITNEMIRLVNENAELYRIAEYIVSKYAGIDVNDAREFVKYLTDTLGYTKSDIISGKADKTIFNWVKSVMLAKNSVLQVGEKKEETQLKTKKENISPSNFKKRILIFVTVAIMGIFLVVNLVTGTVNVVKDSIEQHRLETSVSQSIGMLASAPGNDAYEYKMNIVSQNSYHVPGQFESDGSPVVAYRNEDIAADIIKVCSYDPALFDICLQNAYFNMDKNRLGNMDEVIKWLRIYSEDKEELSYIFEEVKDCKIFVEYLVKQGFISPNDEDYPTLEAAIQKYKESDYRAPFTALPKEYQKVIQKIVDEYENNIEITYPLYVERLKELVELGRTGGGRNGS